MLTRHFSLVLVALLWASPLPTVALQTAVSGQDVAQAPEVQPPPPATQPSAATEPSSAAGAAAPAVQPPKGETPPPPAVHEAQPPAAATPVSKPSWFHRHRHHGQQPWVAAANPLAVDAGLEILRRGGKALDAAVAVQTVLGLVEPQSSGVAGGAFLLYYDAHTGKLTAFDGREKAPAGARGDMFLDEHGKPMSYVEAVRSGRSTGVPGVMAMLWSAHHRFGALHWKELFQPAIRSASRAARHVSRRGLAVSAHQ
jgi:gamma-glutamyltranspeptidase/glutathione hydrolase